MQRSYSQLIRHSENEKLFEALEMSTASLIFGYPLHVHAQGVRGTGKTTIVRAIKSILPKIKRIKGCIYNCEPKAPHCPLHRGLTREEIVKIGIEEIPMPFIEISHSAKIGTIVGSVDLSRLVDPSHPEAALLPGSLPQAHRGIIFVDEVNRLADTSPELADVLLDLMGTKPGRVQIEETGLARVELPVQVNVWAASNPDEEPGPLDGIRRQLSDRFDFTVTVGRPAKPDDICAILSQNRPTSLIQRSDLGSEEEITRRLFAAASRLGDCRVPEELTRLLAGVYVDFGLESLRGLEAIEWGAMVSAGMASRHRASWDDMARVVPLVLAHRVGLNTLSEIIQFLDKQRKKIELIEEDDPGESANPTKRSLADSSRSERRRERGNRQGIVQEMLYGLKSRLGKSLGTDEQVARGYGRRVTGSGSCEGNDEGTRQMASPSEIRMVAPPNAARPITDLSDNELILTEEDLDP